MENIKMYNKFLAFYVKKSGLTLREIANCCKIRGGKIDPSYISKLQNGRLPPPSEKVSRILAIVLNCDPNLLIYLGYIAKAPSIICERLHSNDAYLLASRIGKLSPEYKEIIISELRRLERLEMDC